MFGTVYALFVVRRLQTNRAYSQKRNNRSQMVSLQSTCLVYTHHANLQTLHSESLLLFESRGKRKNAAGRNLYYSTAGPTWSGIYSQTLVRNTYVGV